MMDCCPSAGGSTSITGGRATLSLVDHANGLITLPWEAVSYDDDGYFDLSAYNALLTIPSSGRYEIGVWIQWHYENPSVAITTVLYLIPRRNGVPESAGQTDRVTFDTDHSDKPQGTSWTREYSAGDEITVDVFNSSAVDAFDIDDGAFWINKLR